VLNYDPRRGGFVGDLEASKLKEAPSYKAGNSPNWSDRTYGNPIDQFYEMTPGCAVILKAPTDYQARNSYPRRLLRLSHFLSSICATRRDGCRSMRSRPALLMRPHRSHKR